MLTTILLLTIPLLVPAKSLADSAKTCRDLMSSSRAANWNLLGQFEELVYKTFYNKHSELMLVYIRAKKLNQNLDYLVPFIGSNDKAPLFFWNQKIKDEIQTTAINLQSDMQNLSSKQEFKQLKEMFSKIKDFLNETLTSRDLSTNHSFTVDQIQSLTKSSFYRALNAGVLKIEKSSILDLSENHRKKLSKMEDESSVDWENGHLDQGYGLTSKPLTSALEAILGSTRKIAAFRVTISASAKDPMGEKGRISQVHFLNNQFEIVNSDVEFFAN